MDDDYAFDDLDTLTALLDDDDGDGPPGFNYDDDDTPVSAMPSQMSTQKNSKNQKYSETNPATGSKHLENNSHHGEPSKEDLMDELRRMQERMKQLEQQVQQKEKQEDITKNKETFSDAISPKPDTRRKKTIKKDVTPQSLLKDTKRTSSTSKILADHDDLTPRLSSSSAEETSPSQSLFGKNKKRAAHTPKSQPRVDMGEEQKSTSSSPYRCKLCEKKFNTLDNYKSHQYMHKKNHPWKCDACQLTFISEYGLNAHKRTHENKTTSEQTTPKLSMEPANNASTLFPKKSLDGALTNGQLKSAKSNQFSATLVPKKNLTKTDEEGKWTTEAYSQIRIVNPKVSSEMMKMRMEGRKIIRMSVIKKHIINGKIEGDWVTIGVIVNKIPPKTSSNGKPYSIWKLNDLHNLEVTVSLFLFGDVHKQHWKTLTGTVIGLLNPEIMSKKDGEEEATIKVDHPQKIMIMGDSKDLGYCRGRRKDGKTCTMFVNKTECEFCQFHVQAAYKKMSAKRTDLQASYVGPQPKVFRQQLKSGTIFYGGQSYTAQTSSSKKEKSTKEKNTLKNLNLSKARELQAADRVNMMKISNLSTNEAAEFLSIANGSESFQDRLVTPTVGSQNLLHHMKKVEHEEKVQKGMIETITASDLLKQHKRDLSDQQRAHKRKLSAASTITSPSQSNGPMLGRGLHQGKDFILEFSPPASKGKASNKRAMERARAVLVAKGPLKKNDPNSIEKSKKLSVEEQAAVRKRVEKDIGESFEEDTPEEQPKKKRKFLGTDLSEIDTNSEEFQKIMKAKSKHSQLLHEVEADLQDKYFTELEKKEKLETKMASIMEKVCKVVTCQQCKYTYFSPAARCKAERHTLKWHEAKQRFFHCKDCKTKTFSFNKIPTSNCRNCGGSKFERTGMLTERKGPKLGSETLLLRGEEEKFI